MNSPPPLHTEQAPFTENLDQHLNILIDLNRISFWVVCSETLGLF